MYDKGRAVSQSLWRPLDIEGIEVLPFEKMGVEDWNAKPSRESIAHHEAGHTAAMVVLRIPVDYVTIVSTETAWGRAVALPHDAPLLDELIMVLAAECAEARFTRDPVITRLRTINVDGDAQIADSLLQRHVDFGAEMPRFQFETHAVSEASRLVAYASEFIDAIADALLVHSTLTGADVRVIRNTFEDNETGTCLVVKTK